MINGILYIFDCLTINSKLNLNIFLIIHKNTLECGIVVNTTLNFSFFKILINLKKVYLNLLVFKFIKIIFLERKFLYIPEELPTIKKILYFDLTGNIIGYI